MSECLMARVDGNRTDTCRCTYRGPKPVGSMFRGRNLRVYFFLFFIWGIVMWVFFRFLEVGVVLRY